ncbi:FixH family protein [Fictibacillus sp. FJAT-27399]|uniref:FixH family protein n=1 Tax=Fictibacillus sp. FJAT-27399 TaxID=1729689 RepID=UPI000783F9BB|nr:FixH family protein [Fictibacillus sp. FJAT-27399]
MQLKSKLVLFLSSILVLTACGNPKHQTHQQSTSESENSLMPVQVKINIDPNQPKTNKPFRIQAKVTQNGHAVNDADDVQFEIWKDGNRKHKKVKVEKAKKGVYSIQSTYSKAGNYHVISHVTARDMHTMPQKQFTIK